VPQDTFWSNVWKNVEPAVTSTIEDVLLLLTLIGALTIVYGALVGLALLGYNSDRIDTLDTIHYWAVLPVVVVFAVSWVIRMLLHVFRKRQ